MSYIVYYGDGEINSRREYSYCNSPLFLTEEEKNDNITFFDYDDITGRRYCILHEVCYDKLSQALNDVIDVIYHQELFDSATIYEDNFYTGKTKFVVKLYNKE